MINFRPRILNPNAVVYDPGGSGEYLSPSWSTYTHFTADVLCWRAIRRRDVSACVWMVPPPPNCWDCDAIEAVKEG